MGQGMPITVGLLAKYDTANTVIVSDIAKIEKIWEKS